MLKRISCAFAIMMFLVSLSACTCSREVVGSNEMIKYAQENELKYYQGETDSFTETVRGGENVIATIGIAPKGTIIMVGVVTLPHGSVKMAKWNDKLARPEVGMSVQVTCVGYFDPANHNIHGESCTATTIPL